MRTPCAFNHTRQTVLASELALADRFFTRLCGLLATPAAKFGCGHGLWIIPSHGVHTFGMRYPIDALYLDRNLCVVHVQRAMPPWRLGAVRSSAAGVLELPAGTLERTGTGLGDQITFRPRPPATSEPPRRRRDSGQTMVVFVLFLAVLLGVAALSADVGVVRVEQTSLQTVADAAALAGAAEIPYGDVTTAAQAAAALNQFSDGAGGNTLTVNNPPAAGPHAGDSQYVEVIATHTLNTYFAGLFGVGSLAPAARAVAHLGNGTGCLYALSPSASGAFRINGTVAMDLQCALYIDSTSADAIEVNGNGTLSATSIGVAGGDMVNGPVTVSPSITKGIVPLADPLASLPVPSLLGPCTQPTVIAGSKSVTINPGVYCSPLVINGSPDVAFNPGTYVLDSGLVINGSPTLTGGGVTLYDAAGSVTLNGSANSTLSAPTTGPYAGILIFQSRTDALPLTVNGHQSVFNGTVYAPAAPIVVNGGWSGSAYGILVGSTISINGSATFNADFNSLPGGSPIKAPALVD
ncbi:MAG: DUF192 domain-containing protein [Terriglobales bacterium]